MSAERPVEPLRWPSDAVLTLPGSKSEANRLLVLAALSGQPTTVTGATACDDVCRLVDGLAALGFDAAFVDRASGTVRVGPRRADAPQRGELFCGNAGTALRFLISVAAVTPGEWTVTGDAHMLRRPIQPLVDAWRQLGVEIEATAGCPPVRVRGGAPREAVVTLDASISSQFLSSLLLVGGALPFPLQVQIDGELASRDYVLLTQRAMWRFGVQTSALGDRAFAVVPGFSQAPGTVDVDGDWSAMGAWTCLGHRTGSRVVGDNLRADSRQADEQLAAVLAAMPARGEHTIDVSAVPDQFLNLAVVAALRDGTTRLANAANLRHKECDRIAVVVRELRKVGADVDELPDTLVVRGGRPLHGATIDPEGDHRVAMAFALLGLVVPGVSIADPDCVAKSYPTFWDDLERVRREHRAIAIVGMRGAGKSTLARALAERLGSALVDTDEQFVAAHGPIAAFVAAHGWPAFRAEEERIVQQALLPGHVVATGGGAIECATTREALRQNAVVVHLRATLPLLKARLAGSDRPSLTGAPVLDELESVLARRAPLYAELADVTLDAALPLEEQLRGLAMPMPLDGRTRRT